jgi:hypothetical protein
MKGRIRDVYGQVRCGEKSNKQEEFQRVKPQNKRSQGGQEHRPPQPHRFGESESVEAEGTPQGDKTEGEPKGKGKKTPCLDQ